VIVSQEVCRRTMKVAFLWQLLVLSLFCLSLEMKAYFHPSLGIGLC